MTRHHALIVAVLALATCTKGSGDTANPDDATPASDSSSDPGTSAPEDGTAAAPEVPPAVATLDPIPNAKPLGSKMWRRFGKGEWTAHTFFVTGEKGHEQEVSIVIDMEGGGEALPDAFDLVVQPAGFTVVDGATTIPGQVPPGMKRRETIKLRADKPGVATIRFTTVKQGQEAGETIACLVAGTEGMRRCKESEAKAAPGPAAGRAMVYCCAKGKNETGEGCEPMTDEVDAHKACMKAKKFSLRCDGEVECIGQNCKCK